eukprot:1167371-Prorocentrum_minimum.AAC.1
MSLNVNAPASSHADVPLSTTNAEPFERNSEKTSRITENQPLTIHPNPLTVHLDPPIVHSAPLPSVRSVTQMTNADRRRRGGERSTPEDETNYQIGVHTMKLLFDLCSDLRCK